MPKGKSGTPSKPVLTNGQVEAALLQSIEKWRRVARGEIADRGVNGCALCGLFYNTYTPREVDKCRGCPVEVTVKNNRCQGTPYVPFIRMFTNPKFGVPLRNVATTTEQKKAANKERLFLVGLHKRFFKE